jgi:hypothetical protein
VRISDTSLGFQRPWYERVKLDILFLLSSGLLKSMSRRHYMPWMKYTVTETKNRSVFMRPSAAHPIRLALDIPFPLSSGPGTESTC